MGPTARIDDHADSIVDLLVSEAQALSAEVGAQASAVAPLDAT